MYNVSMVFSSLTFLFIFLPVVFIGNAIIPKKYVNDFLLVLSLIFYAWGEPKYIVLMLVSIIVNWIIGCLMEDKRKYAKHLLIADIIFNLSLLGYFKYFDFLIEILNSVLKGNIPQKNIPLPIGISFYTFQILSYIIDLYKGKIKAQRKIKPLALYICLFPQLIAGPIVRYADVESQILCRECTYEKTAQGVKRFIYGLAKKVIIANTLAECMKDIFAIDAAELSCLSAWLAAVICTLNIYYDFSGYSDMAIGLGKMLGFDFNENFNYPYLSRSISEFWRRWHISLSSWLKNYVYIPLGGNRKGKLRKYINTFIVFTLSGLWHGAGVRFIVWGVYNGVFIIIEQLGLNKLLAKHKIISRIYSLVVIAIGWIIFEDGFSRGIPLIKAMLTPWNNLTSSVYSVSELIDKRVFLIIAAGILGSGIVKTVCDGYMDAVREKIGNTALNYIEFAWCFCIMTASVILVAGGTYNPFIYFRF